MSDGSRLIDEWLEAHSTYLNNPTFDNACLAATAWSRLENYAHKEIPA